MPQPYYEHGDLHALIQKRKDPFPEHMIWSFLLQMISALHFLHTRHKPIIHRDISPDNILVTKYTKDELNIALADYDISIKSKGTHIYTADVGKPGYWAPEVRTGTYGAKIDIWSLGVVVYYMMTQADSSVVTTTITDIIKEQESHRIMKSAMQVGVYKIIFIFIELQ